MARVNERSHSFTCHQHAYPQVEWTTLAFTPSCRASPHFGVLCEVKWWRFIRIKLNQLVLRMAVLSPPY